MNKLDMDKTLRHENCLHCPNSFSLPADEPFDDGTVCKHDRLVCMQSHEIVSDDHCCANHTK